MQAFNEYHQLTLVVSILWITSTFRLEASVALCDICLDT